MRLFLFKYWEIYHLNKAMLSLFYGKIVMAQHFSCSIKKEIRKVL